MSWSRCWRRTRGSGRRRLTRWASRSRRTCRYWRAGFRRRRRSGRLARNGLRWRRGRAGRGRWRSAPRATMPCWSGRWRWRNGRTCRRRHGKSSTACWPTTAPAARATLRRGSSLGCWTRMPGRGGVLEEAAEAAGRAIAGLEGYGDWRALSGRLIVNGEALLAELGRAGGGCGRGDPRRSRAAAGPPRPRRRVPRLRDAAG